MQQITHHRFSLFRTEKYFSPSIIKQGCFEFIETFTTLEEAKSAQKEYEENTIILPSY